MVPQWQIDAIRAVPRRDDEKHMHAVAIGAVRSVQPQRVAKRGVQVRRGAQVEKERRAVVTASVVHLCGPMRFPVRPTGSLSF